MTRLMRFPGSMRQDPAVDRWMKEHSGELGAIARRCFEVMRACGDDVRELLHDGQPTACVGDAAFAYVDAFRAHVNVGFFRGAELADSDGLLEGTGKFMRHVKLRPDGDVGAAALRRLIGTAYVDMKRRLEAEQATSRPMHVHGFPPIASTEARVLVLGTMPSAASLRARQYYAHPQNAFWKITGRILGFDAAGIYAARKASLRTNRIAVWDVLKSCVRDGSLDSAIDPETIVPNDFQRFFRAHPLITRVCFNGATAEALYARHVQPHLAEAEKLECLRLPSTSPANASIPWTAKLRAWKAIRLAR